MPVTALLTLAKHKFDTSVEFFKEFFFEVVKN